MDAVAAPDGDGGAMLEGTSLERLADGIEAGLQKIGGLGELHGEAGVENVARGHAEMDETAVGADTAREPGQEGNDIMTRFGLDLIDLGHVAVGEAGDRRRSLVADRARGRLGDFAPPGHRLGCERFDLEPDRVAVGGRPDRFHGLASVTGNHLCAPRLKGNR